MWQCLARGKRQGLTRKRASKHRSAFRRTHHHCQPALASVFASVASILSHCKALLCTHCTLCPLCMLCTTAVNFACIQTQLGQFFWRRCLPKASVQSSALFARMQYAATTKDRAPISSDFWHTASEAARYTSVKCLAKNNMFVCEFLSCYSCGRLTEQKYHMRQLFVVTTEVQGCRFFIDFLVVCCCWRLLSIDVVIVVWLKWNPVECQLFVVMPLWWSRAWLSS